jgi:hypothetical protein
VIDGGKELAHVALEAVSVATGELLAAIEGAVGALAHPVGVGIEDKTTLKLGLVESHKVIPGKVS